jgi:putative membrane protein
VQDYFLKEVFQMTGYEFCGGYWWIFPLVMIIFCIFFMRRGCGRMMCGFGDRTYFGDSAMDILNKRYSKGEIDQKEYEEKKKNLETLYK